MEEKDRLVFDRAAGEYDRIRPSYPASLYRDIFSYSGAAAGSRALEIGIGTGQAVGPFLKRGVSVTAIELGERLAETARRKFSGEPGLQVIRGDFLTWEPEAGDYDLIYGATSFHWLPRKPACEKAKRLLKPGGVLALFWNHPFPNRLSDETNRINREVYEKYRPSDKEIQEFQSGDLKRMERELAEEGFSDVVSRLYRRTRTLTSQEYLLLLNTYSDHLSMEAEKRKAFEREMKERLDEAGGVIRIYDTVDLYLARRA